MLGPGFILIHCVSVSLWTNTHNYSHKGEISFARTTSSSLLLSLCSQTIERSWVPGVQSEINSPSHLHPCTLPCYCTAKMRHLFLFYFQVFSFCKSLELYFIFFKQNFFQKGKKLLLNTKRKSYVSFLLNVYLISNIYSFFHATWTMVQNLEFR